MNSWHAARTGQLPTPTPLQQQSIHKLQQQQQHQQLLAQTQQLTSRPTTSQQLQYNQTQPLPNFGSNALIPSNTSSPAPFDHQQSSDQLVDPSWSNIPWSLTSMLQNLVARESDSSRHLLVLKQACEELKREQKEFMTTATVQQMTVGTAALQREFTAYKTQTQNQRSANEARMKELEATVAKQGEMLTALTRRLAHQETSSSTGLEAVQNTLSHTQRDIKERGLIMAKLGDRLMDEVDHSRVTMNLLEGKLKEVERRVYIWEYSTSSTAAALAPTTLHGTNPFSQAASIAAKKQEHFVTHDAIQPAPPGTAVFAAAAKAALGVGKSNEDNLHPLAPAIEQYKYEKDHQAMVQIQEEAQKQQQEQLKAHLEVQRQMSQPNNANGGWQQDGDSSTTDALPQPPATASKPPASPQQQPLPPPTPFSHPSQQHLTPPPPHQQQQPQHPPLPGTSQQAQFHRYMADYTTRNLQRDLLEIAETYQSTIRNEVDGLRGQLLATRRNHSEEMSKQNQTYDVFAKTISSAQVDMKRTISALELFLKTKVSELMERMTQVEKNCGQIDGLSVARSAQMELKYSQRNEEIMTALQKIDLQLAGQLPGTRPRTSNTITEKSNVEKELMMLHINYEQSVRSQQDKNTMMNQEIIRLRDTLEDARLKLQAQITSVHQQMKSLFADAFAAVHNDILPAIAPSATGAHGHPGPTGERARFIMRPKSMEQENRPTARTGQVNITQFETNSQYKLLDSTPSYFFSDKDSVLQLTSTAPLPPPSNEEKTSSTNPSPQPRGFSATSQKRVRHVPVSGLSRGHGSTPATTASKGELVLMPSPPEATHGISPPTSTRTLSARQQRIVALNERDMTTPSSSAASTTFNPMSDALQVGRRELTNRPHTSHGTLAASSGYVTTLGLSGTANTNSSGASTTDSTLPPTSGSAYLSADSTVQSSSTTN